MAIARITSKGQITVPKEVRDRLGVQPGDALEFRFEEDRLEVYPIPRRRLTDYRGLFQVAKVIDFEQERAAARKARGRRLAQGERPSDA
jgi:antitoxin PrlF